MEPEKKSNGALIGLVIIVIILIIGGIYIWQTNTPATEESTLGEVQTSTNSSVTTEDSADLDNLDKDLETVDTNIEASAINSVQ